MKKHQVIGTMSGTSLDGLDIAHVEFFKQNRIWKFNIIKAETLKYDSTWIKRLQQAKDLPAYEFMKLHVDFGHFLGKRIRKFIIRNNVEVDIIASHGQTIFHQPNQQVTVQIGCGASIAAETGKTIVCDFRTLDVANGGQGAPLVPIGDEKLFSTYGACLNIGGYANISMNDGKHRIAWDVCPANTILNYLAVLKSKKYDKDGIMAKQGKVMPQLLNKLNKQKFYSDNPPKSLGNEWLSKHIIPIVDASDASINDKLRTLTEHIAIQISQTINYYHPTNVLITGGGAHNIFLVSRIRQLSQCEIITPSKVIVDFKEALIFGFLGLMRVMLENNCLSSATGAQLDCCGGAIYYGNHEKQ